MHGEKMIFFYKSFRYILKGFFKFLISFFIIFNLAFAKTYIVKSGDSLWKIAKKFHVPIKILLKYNPKIKRRKGYYLIKGEKIYIPTRKRKKRYLLKPKRSIYTIETLENLAQEKEYVFENIVYKASKTVPVESTELQELVNSYLQEDAYLSEYIKSPLLTKEVEKWTLAILNNPKYQGSFLKVLAQAIDDLKNTPYIFGGSNPKKGLDCSSFVQYVYKKFGIELPRTARLQFKVGIPVKKEDLKIGDLVFFRTYAPYASHVGIYIGNGKFIHFSSFYKGLSISSLNHPYFKRRYLGARRVLTNRQVLQILAKIEKENNENTGG